MIPPGILVVTHGSFGEGLLQAAQRIVGKRNGVLAVSLVPEDGPPTVQAKIERACGQVDQGGGVLVLADLLGGTPCNVSVRVGRARGPGRPVEVVTGVNLSMLVSALGGRETQGLEELAESVMVSARKHIHHVTHARPG